jgi:hypothetical protein
LNDVPLKGVLHVLAPTFGATLMSEVVCPNVKLGGSNLYVNVSAREVSANNPQMAQHTKEQKSRRIGHS